MKDEKGEKILMGSQLDIFEVNLPFLELLQNGFSLIDKQRNIQKGQNIKNQFAIDKFR